MQRYEHSPLWTAGKRQPFYYAYWDRCHACKHIQHYEIAKRYVQQKGLDDGYVERLEREDGKDERKDSQIRKDLFTQK